MDIGLLNYVDPKDEKKPFPVQEVRNIDFFESTNNLIRILCSELRNKLPISSDAAV